MLTPRELGNIPISIGTSLALEVSLFGVDPEKTVATEDLSISDMKSLPEELWINVETLFRNLYSALEPVVRDGFLGDKLIPDMMDEMSIISSLVDSTTNGNMKVVYYICEHKSLAKVFPKAKLKTPNTKLQLAYAKHLQDTLKVLKQDKSLDIQVFDTLIKGNDQYIYLMTHHPIDLLSHTKFKEVALLESHTGKLKRRNEWNSKLTNGKKNFRLPFNPMTLQVMGDNGHLLLGQSIKIKRELVKLAEDYKWNSLTTEAKVKANLKTLKDKLLADFLISLFFINLR